MKTLEARRRQKVRRRNSDQAAVPNLMAGRVARATGRYIQHRQLREMPGELSIVNHSYAHAPLLRSYARSAPHPSGPAFRGLARDSTALAGAARALRKATLDPGYARTEVAVAALRRAAKDEYAQRDRHAALALAAADALMCNVEPFGTVERQKAFWRFADALTADVIAEGEEIELLDLLDGASLERVPPFDAGPLHR